MRLMHLHGLCSLQIGCYHDLAKGVICNMLQHARILAEMTRYATMIYF